MAPAQTCWKVWQLRDMFKPDEARSSGNIVANEGPMPIGAHTWQCWVDKKWVEHTLTVTLQ